MIGIQPQPHRILPMKLRLHTLMTLALVLTLLTACVGITPSALSSLGTSVPAKKVDFVELYDYAERANFAYADEPAIRARYPMTLGVRSPGKFDIQYFVEQDDKREIQFITIRGTANKANLLEDFEIKILSDLEIDIPVDSGFDLSTKAILADVKPYLKRDYKTFITGHSLGGAVAALLSVYLIREGYQVERVVTFGQPKFTTYAGVQHIGSIPLTRVVDENDIVPMLPPDTLFKKDKYAHIGPEIILLKGTDFTYLSNHDAKRISVGEFWRSLTIANLNDHHMDNYLKRIASKAGGATEVPYVNREKYLDQISR
jgi:triacylglycerol lipase